MGGVFLLCINQIKERNEKNQKAMREVSNGDCFVTRDFNPANIQWNSLQCTGVENYKVMCLTQVNFLTSHVFEPTEEQEYLI